MPPTGGIRSSLAWQARYPLGQQVSDAVFSPGQPLAPPDQEPVRVWDFPVGINAFITPRVAEPFGFAHLRAFSNVELVRLAIETRKDQLESLHWRLNPRPAIARSFDIEARAARLTQFWRRPDGSRCFAAWLRLAIEDLLAIDAPAFEKRRDRLGRLIGLDVVPGDTIKVLVDETGRTPVPPHPAYQQIDKEAPGAQQALAVLFQAADAAASELEGHAAAGLADIVANAVGEAGATVANLISASGLDLTAKTVLTAADVATVTAAQSIARNAISVATARLLGSAAPAAAQPGAAAPTAGG